MFWLEQAARAAVSVCLLAASAAPALAQEPREDEDVMSPMGRIAQRMMPADSGAVAPMSVEDVPDDLLPLAGKNTQAELSIATDSTGQIIIVGFNDFRGFALNPVSVSGYMYSHDGGVTWTDGGQLPSPGLDTIGATKLPQIFGDPEIVYLGGQTFIYASIMVKKFTATTAAQTMCVHRTTDGGITWQGPFEVTPCTNPNGAVAPSGAPRDAADKEFMHRDPDTGRVMMSWSNFTTTAFAPRGIEISTTYSDDIATANPPTWSARRVVAETILDGQSSIPRFEGNGSNRVYVAWRRLTAVGSLDVNTGFAFSTDNGDTWSAPVSTTVPYFQMDQVLGNDRVNNSPAMDVRHSNGQIYLAYAHNDSRDGADIAFQRSTDGGVTWSSPSFVNSRPGSDRAQWFPWLTVDQTTGRIHVFYYDQGIAGTGDVTEVVRTYSDDGGATWAPPMTLTARPFHAGYGNDTGQPNLGDYNQAVARMGELMAVWAGNPNSVPFTQGQPTSASMDVPDVFFERTSTDRVRLRLNQVTPSDTAGHINGFLDPGDTVNLMVELGNYVTNPLAGSGPVTGISVNATTTTPGVTVLSGSVPFADAPSGGSSSASIAIKLDHLTFLPGTPVELVFHASSAQGNIALPHTVHTGRPLGTVIFSQNFNGAAPGTLPAGWIAAHGGGVNTVPWTTNNVKFGTTSNALFHQNLNDGPGGTNNTRWERAISPTFNVPAGEYIVVEFDVAYDTEDDPNFNILAYDGFFLRVTDLQPGNILRSVLVEAFAEEFTTGSMQHYPKHLPRNSNTSYFEDMSCWAGDSGGFRRVRMKLRGCNGRPIQLRFEYTQDATGIASSVRPGAQNGVMVDNIVVTNVVSDYPNFVPVANAGPDQTVFCAGDLTPVTLDGSGSTDGDGDPLTYEWHEGGSLVGTGPNPTVNAGIGPHTYTLRVEDPFGAASADDVVVKVIYEWSNFLQPIDLDNSSIFKLGRTVPVKFRLLGACANKNDLIAKIYIAKVSNSIIGDEMEAVGTSAADVGNTFRNTGPGEYHFNWSTKGLSTGTWQIRVDLGDGENHTILVSLK